MTHLRQVLSPHLKPYRRENLAADINAGIMVTVLLVPQSMAYALLAGLPPVTGLYASILPVIVYGLLGSTRFLTVGPTAITSVLIFSVLVDLNPAGSDAYLAQAILLAFLTGLAFIMVGLLRLGWLVNFLNRPVIIGYVNAAAIIILTSQLSHLFGIPAVDSASPFVEFFSLLWHITDLNPVTTLLGTGSLAIIIMMKIVSARRDMLWLKRLNRITPLLIVLLSLAMVMLWDLERRAGVVVVGELPAIVPALTLPDMQVFDPALLIGAITIASVGFIEAISTVTFTSASREYVSANRELVAMGVANVVSAISGAFPVTTSISRSSVNQTMGARSGVSSMVAGVCLLTTTVLLADYLYYLPRAVLAAVIISSVINIISIAPIRQIWTYSNTETIPFYVTAGGVLLFGIDVGIPAGVATATGIHLLRTSRPYISILGRIGNTTTYDDIVYHTSARLMPNTLIIRVAENIYFANAQYLENFMRQALSDYSHVSNLVLDCSAITRIDANGLQMLTQVVDEFSGAGIELHFAGLHPHQQNRFNNVRFQEQVGQQRFFKDVHEAVQTIEGDTDLKLEEYHI